MRVVGSSLGTLRSGGGAGKNWNDCIDPPRFGICSATYTEYIPKIGAVKIPDSSARIGVLRAADSPTLPPVPRVRCPSLERSMSPIAPAPSTGTSIEDRVDDHSWLEVADHLDRYGWAIVEKILSADECRA